MSISTKDTFGYNFLAECMDHMYGGEKTLTSKGFRHISEVFGQHGGSWEKAIKGDVRHVELLKEVLESYFDVKDNAKDYGII